MIKRIALTTTLLVIGAAFFRTIGEGSEAQNRQPENRDQEIMVLGPFPLGKLYLKTAGKDDDISKGGGPSNKDMVKALDRCNMYLLVKRYRSADSGKWFLLRKTDKGYETYFKVVLEGKLSHTLKDQQGKDFRVQVSEAVFSVDHIQGGYGPKEDLPHGEGMISFSLETSFYSDPKIPGLRVANPGFLLSPFRLDVNGQIQWKARKKQ